MADLYSEIRRRRVLGTAAIYLGASWGLLEVSATVFPLVGLPEWTVRVALYVLLAGFPIAVALAWFFDIDLRRGRITRTDDSTDDSTAAASAVPTATAPPGSIAVLPFRNMGANPDHEYFSDGLAEELLHVLAGVPEIKVAARTSCFMFKDKDVDVRTIGKQLGVLTVLEGSVRWAGNRIRVTAQLVEARTGYHLMSETLDEEVEDVFALQGRIAGAIVEILRDRLGQSRETRTPVTAPTPTANFAAYQCYLRGRHRWQRRGEEAIHAAIALYEEALVKDPGFARAKSALAAAHAVLHEYAGTSRQASFDVAQRLAREAMELDAHIAEPHAVLGYIALRLWRWSECEDQLMQALALEPNEPLFHQWYANLLNDLGRQADALGEALKAYELDRVSPMANNVLAVCYTLQGRDDEAIRHTRIAREFGVAGIVPAYVEYLADLRANRWEAAAHGWRDAMERAGHRSDWVQPVVDALADERRHGAAHTALQAAQAEQAAPGNILFLQHVLLGDSEAAFTLADSLLAGNRLNHAWLMLPEAAPLRDHAGFRALMEQMGIERYWQEHGKPVLPGSDPGGAPAQDRSASA